MNRSRACLPCCGGEEWGSSAAGESMGSFPQEELRPVCRSQATGPETAGGVTEQRCSQDTSVHVHSRTPARRLTFLPRVMQFGMLVQTTRGLTPPVGGHHLMTPSRGAVLEGAHHARWWGGGLEITH
ncbi:hypothetical protein FHG87_022070 [Trinorchestia longiramus]|nr:hypothetical protein FHG87_022070 [Trinorchestia longiramus]